MRLRRAGEPLTTDRGDASGTAYWSPFTNDYRRDLLVHAFGRELELPVVAGAAECVGVVGAGWAAGSHEILLAPGTGDNMGAALGLAAKPGTVIVSLGTSGTAFAVSPVPTADSSGAVAGFADASGGFLPLVCTLNAALVLSAACSILGVDHAGLDELALRAEPGAGGISLLPYLAGERTPNRPFATGQISGLNLTNSSPENLARAAVEGMLCGMADAVDALIDQGVPIDQIILIGGASVSKAVQSIAPTIFGRPVFIAEPGEYVADGASRQAAGLVGGGSDWAPVAGSWSQGEAAPQVREAYAGLRDAADG
jgi:xylulokinase